MSDEFKEALGVYVGTVDRDEAVETIAGHRLPGAVFVARLESPAGELIWHRSAGELTEHISGWSDDTRADEDGEYDGDRTDVFVFGGGQSEAWFPAHTVFTDLPLVLDIGRDGHAPVFERYSGGVRMVFTGAVLALVFHHSIEHIDPATGDVAPGLGPFDGRSEEER